MPKISLKREQALQLANFCVEHKKDQIFIAKDQGAYLGATCGAPHLPRCIFYFKGCDPKKDPNWYEKARTQFGGDDFGDFLPAAVVTDFLKDPKLDEVEFHVTRRSISVRHYFAP